MRLAKSGRRYGAVVRCGDGRVHGFTLIELVISSALMALILVSGYLCLNSALTSQKLVQSRAEVAQNARVAMAIITADLRSACALSKQFEFLGMDRALGEVEADNLDFGTRHYTPRRPGEGDFCEVSYFIDVEPESGKYALFRRRDPSPDDEPLSGGTREEIARGISGLRFEYYDGWEWFDDWGDPEGRGKKENSFREQPNLTGMPEAVRVTIWFEMNSDRVKNPDNPEPPLAFRTVARLNLARPSLPDTSTDAGDSGDSGAQPPPTGVPTGGQQ